MNFFRKLANWYFRRNSLPYWSIIVLDMLILMMSGVISYWIFSNWTELTSRMPTLLASLSVYALLSIIGVSYFHTYAGVVRYSSFIDLMRVALDKAGIESRPLWKPMHRQPVYYDAPAYVNGVSENLFHRGLCLPSGPMVTEADVKRIIETILSTIS